MANTQSTRRPRGSIRPNGAGFQIRVYAGTDPLTKKPLYLHEQAATLPEAEKARTRLLAKVDEQRHPKGKITVTKLLDLWMDVARIEESTRDRYVIAIDQYLKPTFGELQAAKLGPTRPRLGHAALPHHGHRLPPRRTVRTALAERRLRHQRHHGPPGSSAATP
ncbi:hypothetical protein [Streptomyces sp. 5-10]|uniref:hypothetical protein n=1 Tax=Streptomyces sp. 5-10 TaxID=878925 RepID=UPI00168B7FCE|nr:hypothetical protein [Streptomyces sp. 5-10]MBD3003098.1 hypothetical protein [Streptomyces sp. 5-10]